MNTEIWILIIFVLIFACLSFAIYIIMAISLSSQLSKHRAMFTNAWILTIISIFFWTVPVIFVVIIVFKSLKNQINLFETTFVKSELVKN
ncbi:hypothetical protein [Mycoplasmopsis agassizii]|uniref:hypothetical protein n=1 Tax=Mycoplasmopsis agassizii TaxID=33922 RepID=UPI0015DB9BDF|nr:hypothetical protein [Mycoplasmopsis agassizii]